MHVRDVAVAENAERHPTLRAGAEEDRLVRIASSGIGRSTSLSSRAWTATGA